MTFGLFAPGRTAGAHYLNKNSLSGCRDLDFLAHAIMIMISGKEIDLTLQTMEIVFSYTI